MSTSIRRILLLLAAGLATGTLGLQAQELKTTPPAAASAQKPAAAAPEAKVEVEDIDTDVSDVGADVRRLRRHRHSGDSSIVMFGRDASLAAGQRADAVVSIFGSASSAGEIGDAIVSIFGNTHVTGPVGDAAVAIGGDLYINSKVDGDAVAILGNLELGPEADIGGNTVVVGGTLERDSGARVAGETQLIGTGNVPSVGWLKTWFKECLLYGRPLAFAPGLTWAWILAFCFLAAYILIALAFRGGVDRCVQTFETRPGKSVLAAILTLLLTPIGFLLVVVTVVGMVFLPFLWFLLLCASLFGKTVMLAAIGRRVTRYFGEGPLAHTAVAVLIGGLLVLLLYVVPIIGFIVYKLLGILGLGVVVYTVILRSRERNGKGPTVAPAFVAPAPGGAAAAATGGAEAGTAAQTNDAGAETAAAAALSPAALPLAGFWIRMGALAIDAILIGVLLAFWPRMGNTMLLMLAIYGAVMWKLRSTTIGGIVCNLQVARVDGRPIDWSTAIVRALGCFLSLAAIGIGFFWIAFDERRQAWHDKIAGTVVVRVPKGISLL